MVCFGDDLRRNRFWILPQTSGHGVLFPTQPFYRDSVTRFSCNCRAEEKRRPGVQLLRLIALTACCLARCQKMTFSGQERLRQSRNPLKPRLSSANRRDRSFTGEHNCCERSISHGNLSGTSLRAVSGKRLSRQRPLHSNCSADSLWERRKPKVLKAVLCGQTDPGLSIH